MLDMFKYNWQVRGDWFEWCRELPPEELTKERIGGMGSILATLFHVANGEQIWVNQMQDTPVIMKEGVTSLEEAIQFTDLTKPMTEEFLQSWNEEKAKQTLIRKRRDGSDYIIPYEKIIKHLISHEIHHIGQLSIWAREMGRKPVSSDLIFRDY
jgi:uncharacterized damage-inducible protein DinB